MAGEDDYQESVGQFTDLKPALNASQPVHTVTENVGDSESIARAIAKRATGNADDFETREEAISHNPSSENGNSGGESVSKDEKDPAPDGNHSVSSDEKKTAPTPEAVDAAEKAIVKGAKKEEPEEKILGYSGLTIISCAALVVGGIAGVLFQLTKKKKNQA